MLCIHARNGKYRAKRIALDGRIYLQEDLLPLEYPLGFSIKAREASYFFRAYDEEEQTNWTEELISYCKNKEDNTQIAMADVLICLEEQERNRRCSDSLKCILSTDLLSWLKEEVFEDSNKDHRRDNSEVMWSIHNFHSNHPLCGKAMGFLVAVNEEYKDLFRKFIRPLPAAFWDCVIQIYKRYIAPQMKTRGKSERGQSLCYPEMQVLAEIESDGPLQFYEPSYLERAMESTMDFQKILNENVRWKTKEEILAEVSLKNGIVAEKEKAISEDVGNGGWFSGWIGSAPVELEHNSDLDRDMHGTDRRCGKLSRYVSKRFSCMYSTQDHTEGGTLYVTEYILLKGHECTTPSMELFDDIVRDVTAWVNHESARYH